MSDFASPPPAYYPPMTFGQTLDRVYRLMRASLGPFMGIAAAPFAAVYCFMAAAMGVMFFEIFRSAAEQGSPLPHSLYAPMAVFAIAVDLLPIPVYALYMSAGAFASTQADLGLKVTFRQSYAAAWQRFGRSLWLIVLLILYIYGPILLVGGCMGGAALLMVHGAHGGAPPDALFLLIPLAALFYIAFLVYAVLMILRFAFVFPAIVQEEIPARAALRRSAALTRGARGRIFLVLLVVYAAAYALCLVCVFALFFVVGIGAFMAISAHVTPGSAAFVVLIALAVLVYLAVMIVYASFAYAAINTALAVLYHEQRRRKDGAAPAQLPA